MLNRKSKLLLIAFVFVSSLFLPACEQLGVSTEQALTDTPEAPTEVIETPVKPTETNAPSETPTDHLEPTPSLTITEADNSASLPSTFLADHLFAEGDVASYVYLSDDGSLFAVDWGEILNNESSGEIETNFIIRAKELSFAHLHSVVAYLDFEDQIWIADLAGQERYLIYSTNEDVKIDAEIIWTPDDAHVIINHVDSEEQDLIYRLEDSQIDPWNYLCDRVALSPRTEQLAIWCQSNLDQETYFVLDWGEEGWISSTPPEVEFVGAAMDLESEKRFSAFPLFRNVGWSSDGSLLAYFDPADPSGTLYITQNTGESVMEWPDKAYWLSEIDRIRAIIPGFPIQWSINNQRILIFGVGEGNDPCPTELIEDGPLAGEYPNPACWQVVDIELGDLVWQLSDLVALEPPGRLENFHTYEEGAISPNGNLLALYSFAAADIKLYLIEIDSGAVFSGPPFRILRITWGPPA